MLICSLQHVQIRPYLCRKRPTFESGDCSPLTQLVQCVTLCYAVLRCVTVCYGVLQCVTVCYGVLQCVMLCYGVLLSWLTCVRVSFTCRSSTKTKLLIDLEGRHVNTGAVNKSSARWTRSDLSFCLSRFDQFQKCFTANVSLKVFLPALKTHTGQIFIDALWLRDTQRHSETVRDTQRL